MADQRTIAALRALAERPGTPAEGAVAREMLERLERKSPNGRHPKDEQDIWAAFERHCRGECTTDEFIVAMAKWTRRRDYMPVPTEWTCACGRLNGIGYKCMNMGGHERMRESLRIRFTKGQRVYYNYWAYPDNCPAVVAGWPRQAPENGTHPWGWIILKFDHLKNNRSVPILSNKGCHLSAHPLTVEERDKLYDEEIVLHRRMRRARMDGQNA